MDIVVSLPLLSIENSSPLCVEAQLGSTITREDTVLSVDPCLYHESDVVSRR